MKKDNENNLVIEFLKIFLGCLFFAMALGRSLVSQNRQPPNQKSPSQNNQGQLYEKQYEKSF